MRGLQCCSNLAAVVVRHIAAYRRECRATSCRESVDLPRVATPRPVHDLHCEDGRDITRPPFPDASKRMTGATRAPDVRDPEVGVQATDAVGEQSPRHTLSGPGPTGWRVFSQGRDNRRFVSKSSTLPQENHLEDHLS